jgi:hypothetical protein
VALAGPTCDRARVTDPGKGLGSADTQGGSALAVAQKAKKMFDRSRVPDVPEGDGGREADVACGPVTERRA